MAEENENQEPKEGEEEQSMDEILGSIREILSDEDQAVSYTHPPSPRD